MSTPRERRHIERYFDFEDKVAAVNYYTDTMLNKTLTMFKYNNLPKTIPERELELLLQTVGKCIVTDWEDTLVALDGNSAPPNDVYYRPTHYIVANPWAKINHEFELMNRYLVKTESTGEHKPAVLFRNDPLDRGLLPIIHKYAAMLTEVDLTQYLAAVNFRSIYAITANTDREYESAKSFLNGIKEGRQGVMMEEEMSNGIKTQPFSNATQGYITQTIELRQYVWGMFLNEIGLNANYNMKRERLSANETDLNEDSLRPLIDAMLEERQVACDEINAQFGTDISVEFNSAWEKYNMDFEEQMEAEEQAEEEPADEPIEVESNDEEVENTEVTDDATEDVPEDTSDESESSDEPDTEESGEGDGEEAEDISESEEPDVEVNVEINVDEAEEVSVEETDEEPEDEEESEEESEDESESEDDEEEEEKDED